VSVYDMNAQPPQAVMPIRGSMDSLGFPSR
jgi:hypothetical protein